MNQHNTSRKQQPLVAVLERSTTDLTVISGQTDAQDAYVVVRDNGLTAGYYHLDLTEVRPLKARAKGASSSAQATAQTLVIDSALAASAGAMPVRTWKRGEGSELFASVVICTVGTNPLLVKAVDAILDQNHKNFELIVVDNAPRTGAVRQALADIEDDRMRIIKQPRSGLSNARNAGVSAAAGEIIAFTDDDAQAHPDWLGAMCDVFAADHSRHVGAVTGPVFPAELAHDSQRYFEARGGFPKALDPTVWTVGTPDESVAWLGTPGQGGPLYPVTTARVGAGVSMAYRREALETMGEFDTRLGAGTVTGGGEDLDAFARVLRCGYAIVTTPDAVIHHVHRRDLEGLKKQTYGDGTGMAALLTKSVLTHPSNVVTLARRVPAVARRVAPNSERMTGSEPGVPPELTRNEIQGFLRGPFLFAKAALANQRLGR